MITTGTRSAQQLEDAKELEGMRVFVVEDEGLVAMSVEDMLSDLRRATCPRQWIKQKREDLRSRSST